MFKKSTAMILSLLFAFSAFGAATLFSGVITAGAVYYDYYNYEKLPGWSEFTAQDLTEIYNPGLSLSQCDVPSFAPERVEKVTKIDVINSRPGEYAGHITLGSFVELNIGEINPDNNPINLQWCAKKAPSSGASLAGGRDFSDDTGICFWVAHNTAGEWVGSVKINLFCLPYAGPTAYYTGDDPDMVGAMNGFCFEASKTPDADGYLYFDFKTDFEQVDWFWKHDDGKNYSIFSGNGKRPLPYNMLPYINAMSITIDTASDGDVFYIGDFCAYSDSRIHPDELAEAIDVFDALDPEAYTEESYTDATEVYLRAYEMLLDENFQDNYTQRQVDAMAQELLDAISALLPMFPARADVKLNGFGVWDDDDLDAISDGGVSFDPVVFAEEGVGPDEPTLEIIANGDSTFSPPYYGWSCFKSTVDEDGEEVAVKNPFGADLSDTDGIRFWLKNPDECVPVAMQIFVGVAGEVEFVAEDFSISRPMEAGKGGYVSASWSSFYEFTETDAEIFDYLDQLDFIAIQFEDLRQVFYFISDLHAFVWSLQAADMSELTRVYNNTRAYVSTLNEADYTPRSWEKLQIALDSAEALLDKYGVTQDEADAATEEINRRVNNLFLLGPGPTLDELNYLYSLISCAKNYWRGNYVATTYNALKTVTDRAEEAIDDDITSEFCQELCADLENAIAGLIPITHTGTIEKGFFSFESYNTRYDLNGATGATGDRTKDVDYSLAKRSDVSIIPEGYSQALMMKSRVDMSSEEDDEHGVLQFKSMYRNGAGSPVFITPSNGDPLVNDLTGSDGFLVWVGVNDVNLVSEGTFRVGMSCCDIRPLFEMHAIDIPLPPTGSGWIYIPWNYFDHYDEWTNGEPIRLNEIRFYIFRFDGKVKEGLEVYITGLQAYTGTAHTTHVQPAFSNLTNGQTVDVSEGAFVPDWNIGNAMLDGKYFTYGSGIDTNGEHTIKLINGNKSTEVSFTVTGGETVYERPIVYGVANGGEYDEAVTLTWNVGEATLNGNAIEQSTVVSAPGEYTIHVVNGDKETTVTFKINGDTPPAYKRGDMDEDGEITVGDSLKALRIAAKLVAATDKDMLIGDVDNDGDITVGDALKILRVAAKLVPESDLG